MRCADRPHHIQQVDGSFEGAPRSRARGVLSLLQHPPPVPRAVLLALGPSRRSLTGKKKRRLIVICPPRTPDHQKKPSLLVITVPTETIVGL